MLGVSFVAVSDSGQWFYQGGSIAFAIAVACIIADSVNGTLNRERPPRSGTLRYLGQISYGLYLWHWPMIVGSPRTGWAPTGSPRRSGSRPSAVRSCRTTCSSNRSGTGHPPSRAANRFRRHDPRGARHLCRHRRVDHQPARPRSRLNRRSSTIDKHHEPPPSTADPATALCGRYRRHHNQRTGTIESIALVGDSVPALSPPP